MIQVYEIPNTFTRDLPLDEQIKLGCNDWRAESGKQVAFGHTREEALANLNRGERPEGCTKGCTGRMCRDALHCDGKRS